MDERELIGYLRNRLRKPEILANWLNDDCEIIDRDTHYELVTVDTSSEKADFPSDAPPFDIGYFSTALSLSDIAACGGIPEGILVSVSVSQQFDSKIYEIYDGIIKAAEDANTQILGGDSNSAGEFSISVVSIGYVEKNKVLRRSTAKEDDIVLVTGKLGSFNLGHLQYLIGQEIDFPTMLRQPARIRAGQILSDLDGITSCIDLPDGLAKALIDNMPPNLGFEIVDNQIPIVSTLFETNFETASNPAGDIELLFTANPNCVQEIQKMFSKTQTQITSIGRVIEEPGIKLHIGPNTITPITSGFIHKFDGFKLFD